MRPFVIALFLLAASCSGSKAGSNGSSGGSSGTSGPCDCVVTNSGLTTHLACGWGGCIPVNGEPRKLSCTLTGLSDEGSCVSVQGDGGSPQCQSGDKRCLGERPQSCDANLLWQNGAACTASQTCVSGTCRDTTSTSCSADGGAGCDLDCSTTSACQTSASVCGDGGPCTTDCSGRSACQFASVDCSANTSCNVDCTGESACQMLTARCGSGDCRFDCGSTSACDGNGTQPALIDCTDASSCEVSCTDPSTCQDLVILCGSGPCNVTCSGQSACDGMSLFCGSGPCSVTCTGSSSHGFAMDCGASTSCSGVCH